MTVRKIKGVYNVDFRYEDPLTGEQKRFRRSTGKGTTKREAERLERAWRTEVEKLPEASKLQAAFSGFAKTWLDLYVAVQCKPSTYRSREQVLRVNLVPFFGDANLRTITPMMVQRYKALKIQTHAAKTVNNHLGILSRLFRSAVDWNYCDRNPVTGVGLLPLPPQEFRFWDRDQSDVFLEKLRQRDPKHYPVFRCALRTGLRQGELLALRWGDLDFVKRRLFVRRNFTHGKTVTPKTGKSRMVPMSPGLASVLWDHRHLRGDLVFCREDGSHLSGDVLKRPMWRAQRAAGLPYISFHDLRHSFASQLVMKGVPLKAVQEFLGHSTMEMTMRYAHLSPAATQAYVEVLDEGSSATGPVGRSQVWAESGQKPHAGGS